MKSNLLLMLFLSCIFQSCRTSQPTPNNLENITKEFSIDTNRIRFNGIYNTYDTSLTHRGDRSNEISVTDVFIVFIKKNKIFRDGCCTIDSIAFQPEFYKRLDSAWIGTYMIKRDSIFAYIPTGLYKYGGMTRTLNANYSGYIKNRDTIIDWKMVPPFPDVNPKANGNFIYHTTPRMLYFIKNDAVRCLDSIAGQ